MADPIASSSPASVPELCAALQEEPLFHMSLGSKELFHSNLIGWLAERFPDQMARVFAPWLVANPSRAVVYPVRREFLHLDLTLEFQGYEPLVLENKDVLGPAPQPAQRVHSED